MKNYTQYLYAYLKESVYAIIILLIVETYLQGIEYISWIALWLILGFIIVGSIQYLLK